MNPEPPAHPSPPDCPPLANNRQLTRGRNALARAKTKPAPGRNRKARAKRPK